MGHKAKVKAANTKGRKENNEKKKARWPEAERPYARYELDMDPKRFVDSHKRLLDLIEALLAQKVDEEMKRLPKMRRKQRKVKGRQYTAADGVVLVRLLPADDDPNREVVTLLIGLDSLYLQAFHVGKVWFILKDAEAALPPASQVPYGHDEVFDKNGKIFTFNDGIYLLPWNGSYTKVSGGRYQKFKYGAFQGAYEGLSEARVAVADEEDTRFKPDVFFYVIGICECLRFWDVHWWVLAHTTNPLMRKEVILPRVLGVMIGHWGTYSTDCYGPNPPACVRVVKRDLAQHELLREEPVYQTVKAIKKEVPVEISVNKNELTEGEEAEEDKQQIEEEIPHDEDGEKTQEEEENKETNDSGEDMPLDVEGGSKDAICTITLSADKRLVACGIKNGQLNICETDTRTPLGTLEGLKSEPQWVKWHPGGHFLIAGSQDGDVLMWSTEHSALLATFKGQSTAVCGDFSPDGKYVCAGAIDGSLTIWDPNNFECKHAIKGENYHKKGINCLAFTLDSQFIITGSDDTSASIVDVHSGMAIGFLNGHTDSVGCVSVSESGIVATGGRDGNLILWDMVRQKARFICPHNDVVLCLLWLEGLRFLASGCKDGEVRIWDSATGGLAFCSSKGYPGTMRSLVVNGSSLLIFTSVATYEIDISMYQELFHV